ncbi:MULTISPECIES: hypothetical protein [Chelatococcus]|uniref:Uncharacterized protein n=1 Tax=Chelatococcus caeni TaxID=1348468 RepID=A0A840BW78_9HYPH|nr:MULTISPECIES: hypothetical protein [Chelatococcus]ALA16098.1 hypothetical protein AL346_00180 [Chelatococcus sp. CO-6]MBB4017605.1 hypothetical protein [Chelatococcus caeni]
MSDGSRHPVQRKLLAAFAARGWCGNVRAHELPPDSPYIAYVSVTLGDRPDKQVHGGVAIAKEMADRPDIDACIERRVAALARIMGRLRESRPKESPPLASRNS